MPGDHDAMTIRIVQLGVTPRLPDEGPRLGTVRRPPRGVRKEDYGRLDYYDSWLPLLSPSAELMTQGRAAEDDKQWNAFARAYRKEMSESAPSQMLDTLAALSHSSNLSMGCYCDNPLRCHRSLLTQLLTERDAAMSSE